MILYIQLVWWLLRWEDKEWLELELVDNNSRYTELINKTKEIGRTSSMAQRSLYVSTLSKLGAY